MNEIFRHKKLLAALEAKQMLSTLEIMHLLNVSPATARRDINKLSEQKKLRKVRNGAEAINVQKSIEQDKPINNFDEKRRIAEAASRLCREGDSVILTCGSTMQLLGQALCGQKLQIITNFLPLANYLIEQQHDDVVIMGGQYNKNKKVTLSLNQQNEFMYAANIMFTSGKGFTPEGLFKTDMIIANSEAQMSSKASKYVVLLDSTKLGKEIGMLFRDINNVDLLITGKEADPNIVQSIRDKGVEIILA
ncbi:HTH-type transcriptional regulator UlaR [Actinobacillus pleuropneumoniae]|uniref:HTH-type transcriptional regulator ulaR n=6 Tax=Actinobacillus pleuropneumoniae TaxID=715 RepID=A3N300_ACTP2|nr:HTH-type transcriptional regulator UlaR [Actinobacillus pleuropneumoniae]ABN74786.1 HTH-type transcriptional regulator ulaR [Actinobacillus pleuropneumoniae serovar 5b str. L20]ABY70286.1 probable DeoR-family transcription repressor [Actinobacillus pleuropneumoniae serovar 3 str. JL03]ACE62415.1 HTH-type transcriptional regulator ulaR [Actinobacillus pleuropneumoniae serovar 7 str. AP76]ASU15550.1 HTH-type transcriptional regulator UlaR [Actinobacillus pleuropneumoniae]AWG96120.1 HTH-type t